MEKKVWEAFMSLSRRRPGLSPKYIYEHLEAEMNISADAIRSIVSARIKNLCSGDLSSEAQRDTIEDLVELFS